MNNTEFFKDIPGYEGMYQVSNLGRVKSLSREVLNRGKFPTISKEKFITPIFNGKGYYILKLFKNGNSKSIAVHVIVAMAFLNHTPDGSHKIVVDHINNIKTDNRLENLQLLSQRENCSKDRKGGTSQYIGVNWCKTKNKWRARITIDGKYKFLAYYSTEYEAHYAYQSVLLTLKNN